MEAVVSGANPNPEFWRGQRVLLTGHTGFKGGWAALWLQHLGAEVRGYALAPSSQPSLFVAARIDHGITSQIADVRDLAALQACFDEFRPTIVVHMAAQPLVRASYAEPIETYSTNVMGVVNLLEISRRAAEVPAVLVVTTDKCYENREQIWPYRETDRLGGRDPYSNSKACAELVTSSYWWSYFASRGGGLGTGRAGNVIGGGDWSKDRLTPDLVKAFSEGRPAILRRPDSIRPWQHVLEPICGYLLALERLAAESSVTGPACWNFGPDTADNVDVGSVARQLAEAWGEGATFKIEPEPNAPHEATLLALDSTRAKHELDWRPRWPLKTSLAMTADWYKAFYRGLDMRQFTLRQIQTYLLGEFNVG